MGTKRDKNINRLKENCNIDDIFLEKVNGGGINGDAGQEVPQMVEHTLKKHIAPSGGSGKHLFSWD